MRYNIIHSFQSHYTTFLISLYLKLRSYCICIPQKKCFFYHNCFLLRCPYFTLIMYNFLCVQLLLYTKLHCTFFVFCTLHLSHKYFMYYFCMSPFLCTPTLSPTSYAHTLLHYCDLSISYFVICFITCHRYLYDYLSAKNARIDFYYVSDNYIVCTQLRFWFIDHHLFSIMVLKFEYLLRLDENG